MLANANITATFVQQFVLTVTGGTGSGTYDTGMVVPIQATPAPGLTFKKWTGDTATVADVGAASTTITMVEDADVTALCWVPGDVNGDDCVNVADLLTVRNSLGKSGENLPTDVCGNDNMVNVADLLFVRNHMGQGPGCH
jgi:hypothetical protein